MLRVLDLFSGAGGMSLGLEQAGFEITAAVDNWKPAAETFRKSHLKAIFFEENIYDFNENISKSHKNLGKIDVVVGGPPCQGFCGMNRHRSISDRRNSLVEAFVQTIEIIKPGFVCMENVTGILSLGNGVYLNQLLESFSILGYDVDFRLIQSGYYGVPQNRWRFLLLATKPPNKIIWPEPIHSFHRTAVHNVGKYTHKIHLPITNERGLFFNPIPQITVFDAISDLPLIKNGESYEGKYLSNPCSIYQKLLRKNCRSLTCHSTLKSRDLHVERYKHIPKNKQNSGWLDLPDELKPNNLKKFSSSSYDNRFGRLTWQGSFNTIMAKVEPYWGRVIHPEQDRLISVRESARAQGFPDSVEFFGNLSDQYRLVGNAIPPPLGRAIGAAILDSARIKNEVIDNYKSLFN